MAPEALNLNNDSNGVITKSKNKRRKLNEEEEKVESARELILDLANNKSNFLRDMKHLKFQNLIQYALQTIASEQIA